MPPLFTPTDIVVAAISFAALIACIVAALRGERPSGAKAPMWARIGTVAVGLIFVAGVGIVLKWRMDLRSLIVCRGSVPGVWLLKDGGTVPACDAFEAEMRRIFEMWDETEYDRPDLIQVWVKPLPFELHRTPGQWAGWAYPLSNRVAVGMDGRPLDETALAHEVGHVICDCSHAELERLADEQGVPF